MSNELDPNMSIKEWVENDIQEGAWSIVEFALSSIEHGTYHRNGVFVLHEMSRVIMAEHELSPPEWVKEIRAILEKHKKDEYEWTRPPGNTRRMTGPQGPLR
jgi:hypothetical protein